MPLKSPAVKGRRKERELVKLFEKLPGWSAKRVPLSGAAEGFPGDVHAFRASRGCDHPAMKYVIESKARQAGAGFKTIERWLGNNDMLVLWRDRQPPLILMPWHIFSGLV